MQLRLWLLLLTASSLALSAEDRSSDETAPEPIFEERVDVTEAAPAQTDVAAFATTIDARKLAQRGDDLADLLRRVPGARVRDYGGLGSYATVSVRASTAEQVAIFVDGVPQNRALGGPVDLSSIAATDIEQITVYRGFGPAELGLGGIGGAIEIRTRADSEAMTARVDLLAGELSTARLSAGGSLPTGDTGSLRLALESLDSDGDFRYRDDNGTEANPDDDFSTRRANNDRRLRSVQLRQEWGSERQGSWHVDGRYRDAERGVPGIGSLPDASARLDERQEQLDVGWRSSDATDASDVRLNLNAFRERWDFDDPDGEFGPPEDRTTRVDGYGAYASWSRSVGGHRLLARAELRDEQAAIRERLVAAAGGADRRLGGLTIEDVTTIGRLVLAPALRLDLRDDRFRGSTSVGIAQRRVEESDWSGKLALALPLSGLTKLRASVGRFFRAPNLRELFGDRGAVVGNPTLKSESGLSAELGASSGDAKRRWTAEVVAFARRTDDLILIQPINAASSKPLNLPTAEVRGIELSGNWQIDDAWQVEFGGSWQDPVDASGGELDGRRLPYQPNLLGFAAAAFHTPRWQAGWEWTYVGENSTESLDLRSRRIPARAVSDLSAGYTMRDGWRVGFDLRNVFDLRTRDVASYPLPDRTLFAHVGWSDGEGAH